MNRPGTEREQKLRVITTVLFVVIFVVVLQVWLLTASMSAYLGGDHSVALPGFLASLGLLGLNVYLLRYVWKLDRN